MQTLDMCLDAGTGVMEGSQLNLMRCILFNITWASFIRSIVHIPVEESHGTFIWGYIFLVDDHIFVGEGGYASMVT